MLGNVKRPYKKKLAERAFISFWNYDLLPYAGTVVTVTQHNGPFRTVRTWDGKVFYGIGRGVLEAVKS